MVDSFRGECGNGAGEFFHDAGHRNAEHALSAAEQVNDFFGAAAFVNGGAVRDEGDFGEVFDAEVAELVDGLPNVLEGNTSVEQSFDDF